jgi:hypothetical protein
MSRRLRLALLFLALFVVVPAVALGYVIGVDREPFGAVVERFGPAWAAGLIAGLAADAYFVLTGQVKARSGAKGKNASTSRWRPVPVVVSVALLAPILFSSDPRVLIVMFAAGFGLAVMPLALYSVFSVDAGG